MKALEILKPAAQAVGERNRALYAIWHGVAAGRVAPRRDEITMKMLRQLTQWLWLVEIIDNGQDFRFRLIGDGVVQFFSANHTGAKLGDNLDNPFFRNIALALNHCLRVAKPLVYGPAPSGYAGKEHWEYEFLLLPLSQDGGEITCLFGTMDLWPLGTNHNLEHRVAANPSV